MESHSAHLMREFVRARLRGDRLEMQRFWGLLLRAEWPRLLGFITLHGRKTLRSQAERDEALSEVGQRMTRRLVWTFDGTTVEDYNDRVSGLVRICCLDVQRRAAKRTEREGRSLDATRPDTGEQYGWIGETYARIEQERTDAREEQEVLEETIAEGQGFLDWAVPRLSPKRRAVFELLRVGKSPAEVQEDLGISRNDVDQTKRRAIQDLIKLKEQYPS